MSPDNQFTKAAHDKYDTKIHHLLIYLAMIAIFAFAFHKLAVPNLIQGFVASQFFHEGDIQKSPTEYILDFDDKDGKVKSYSTVNGKLTPNSAEVKEGAEAAKQAPGEWFVKAAGKLGEDPIVLESWSFSILSVVFGLLLATIISIILPPSIGYISSKFHREIEHTKAKIRLQTGFGDDVVDVLTMPDHELANLDRTTAKRYFSRVWERTIPDQEHAGSKDIHFDDVFDDETDLVTFRNEGLVLRIKEFFSDFVSKEIDDIKRARGYSKNRFKVLAGMRLYMSHHFTETYSNNVTGLAYLGAALLIIAVGVRGLKFIPSTRPGIILFAILLEFTLLALLGFVLIYTEEEERMDKMLKKMEDASRSQLETLKDQTFDMHRLAETLEGGTAEAMRSKVEQAITEYFSSNDHINKVIAEEISQKIVVGLRESVTSARPSSKK
ncbi:MAG: hypothetical protein V4642_15655 [Bacteroidota bacterium]